MNKIRITGIAILLFTFVSRYYLETDAYDFWYGAAGGVGGMLAIIGRIKRPA
ncbi:hypothetical protein [Salegentibacter salarius]|uniref:hypothetical protein n=1 Tax=Salegentibacter salarius TaxID=435906 RepID=UPI0009CC3C05|nr:hypothetical protein [Salegentibacter salarius]SLJ86036.1 hypothetical protein SAMN05660445_00005 [Salegentibacter salarius]